MRFVWTGVLMMGMLMILWGVFEARQGDVTSDPMRYYGEDGTPLPPPNPPPPPPE